MQLSAVVRWEGRLYVAWCPELDIASQGKTVEDSLANLTEAVELYLEDEDAKPPAERPIFTTIEVGDGEASGSVGV